MRWKKSVYVLENDRCDSVVVSNPKKDSPLETKAVHMDDALAKTNYGIYNYGLILLCGTIISATLIETMGISYVIPVSECDLRLTPAQKGILSGVSLTGVVCASFLWGYLADTRGRRQVMIPSLLITFLVSLISSFEDNFYLLVALRFIAGFFVSGCSAAVFVYLGEFHCNEHRSRAIMSSAIMMAVGTFPLMAYFVINQDWQFFIPIINVTYKPWRLFLVACSLPGLLSSVIMMFLPESPRFVFEQGDKAKAYEIVKQIYRINNNGGDSDFPKFEILEDQATIENRKRIIKCKESRFPLLKSIWIQISPLLKPPYLSSTFLFCLAQFIMFGSDNGLCMFSPEILNKMATNLDSFVSQRISMCEIINMRTVESTNSTDAGAGQWTTEEVCITRLEFAMIEQGVIFGAIFLIGSAVVTILVDKIGKYPVLLVILNTAGVGILLCMLCDIPLIQVCAFIGLLCSTLGMSITNAATVEHYPIASRAMALCIAQMFGRLGCVVGANITAQLLYTHCEVVFYVNGWALIAFGLLAYYIPSIHSKTKKVEKFEKVVANAWKKINRPSLMMTQVVEGAHRHSISTKY